MNAFARAVAFIAALAVLLLSGREAAARLPQFAAWVQSLGVWGPLAFVAGYAACSLLLVPVFLLMLTAGALWGFNLGLVYAMLGAAVGSTVTFFAARHVVRRFVERYVARHPRLVAIDRAVEAEGVRLVFLLRLSPVVPFILLNYVLGISRVRFTDYSIGLVGMVPAAAMYVYAGKVAGDLAALASGVANTRGPTYYIVLTGGLVATVAATALVTRAARKAIEEGLRASD